MFDKTDTALSAQRLFNGTDTINNQMIDGVVKQHITEFIKSSNHDEQITALGYDRIITNNFNITESEATDIMNSSNIFTPDQIHANRFNKFARYGIIDPYNEHMNSREYIFFTKPDLHIFDTSKTFSLYSPLNEIPFFRNAYHQYPESLLSLQQTHYSKIAESYPNKFDVNNKFIPLLSNHVSSSLDLPGINATETINNANLYQINTSYRDGSEVSDCSYEFTLEFTDTKYLDVYMFFKAYDEYIRQEYIRDIRPTKVSYIDDKINSKQFSLWKIIVDDTNTIMFYAKATGVYPLGVPRESMSNFENTIKYVIPFKGQFVKDLNPLSLSELNHITAMSLGTTETALEILISNIRNSQNKNYNLSNSSIIPLYNRDNNTADTSWANYPYIIKRGKRNSATDKEGELYKLIWIR